MYSELIYTRCGQGIDILENGKKIPNPGYKVYSCSRPLLQGKHNMDLQFLLHAAQTKQPDDAYLYFVPESSDSFILNCHHISADLAPDKRAGFLSHIIIGDYQSFYPFELFGGSIWDAKQRKFQYYYDNPPPVDHLEPRNDIKRHMGYLNIENIRKFITDGRQEALMSAVSFLISQYDMPAEERKYLIIKDESKRDIELWIAAIEYAFSPKIAASIPFATQMNDFFNSMHGNLYTINGQGIYQSQINLQDKNQKRRYRAMIVGVEESDKVNAAKVRVQPNLDSVLLDGKAKQVTFEADIKHNYFKFITRFDDLHQSFCQDFLQNIDITQPSSNIFQLFVVYNILKQYKNSRAGHIASALAQLNKYSLSYSQTLQKSFDDLCGDIPRFLQEDLHSGLQIIQSLQKISKILNKEYSTNQFAQLICQEFDKKIFRTSTDNDKLLYWSKIKNSSFVKYIASYIVAPERYKINEGYLKQFTAKDWLAYTTIFVNCTDIVVVQKEYVEYIVDRTLNVCYQGRDADLDISSKVLQLLNYSDNIDTQLILLSIAKKAKEQDYAKFIINTLIENDKKITSSDDSIINFINKLNVNGMGHLCGEILFLYTKKLDGLQKIKQALSMLDKSASFLSNDEKVKILEAIDIKLDVKEKSQIAIAKAIMKRLPEGGICPNSAHLIAMSVLDDKLQRANLLEIYGQLLRQGFPFINDKDYINFLLEKIFNTDLTPPEWVCVIALCNNSLDYINPIVKEIINSKQPKAWNALIYMSLNKKDEKLTSIIIEQCAEQKHAEKILIQLLDIVYIPDAYSFFKGEIMPKVEEVLDSKKSQTGFWSLFKKR